MPADRRNVSQEMTEARVEEITRSRLRTELRKAFSTNLSGLINTDAPIVINNPGTPSAAVGLDYDGDHFTLTGTTLGINPGTNITLTTAGVNMPAASDSVLGGLGLSEFEVQYRAVSGAPGADGDALAATGTVRIDPFVSAVQQGGIVAAPVIALGGPALPVTYFGEFGGAIKVGEGQSQTAPAPEDGAIQYKSSVAPVRFEGRNQGQWVSLENPFKVSVTNPQVAVQAGAYQNVMSYVGPVGGYLAAGDGHRFHVKGDLNVQAADGTPRILFLRIQTGVSGGPYVTVWEDDFSIAAGVNARAFYMDFDYEIETNTQNSQRMVGRVCISDISDAIVGLGSGKAPTVDTPIGGLRTALASAANQIEIRLDAHWDLALGVGSFDKRSHTVERYTA
jgi:hypothetical protein